MNSSMRMPHSSSNIGNPARTRQIAARVLVFLATLFPYAISPHSSLAAEAESSTTTSNLYRRVFVPAGRVDLWPRDGEKYIPVEAKDFEKWVQTANDGANSQSPGASIDLAEYVARFDDNGRLHGTAKLNITVRGKTSTLLPLQQLSPNLNDVRWQNNPKTQVRIGVWGSPSGKATRAAIEVPDSGILEFNWSVQTSSVGNKSLMPWQFPASTASRLLLDLPEGIMPTMEGSVVLESSRLPAQDGPAAMPRRRWLMALTPSANSELQLLHDGGTTGTVADTLSLSDESEFNISAGGIAVTSTWRLEGAMSEHRELVVPLPPDGQITSISRDGNELAWRIDRISASYDQAIITLPTVTNGNVVALKITSWLPLTLDRDCKLPILRPDSVSWTSGNLQVSIAAPLELQNLNPIDCVQVGARHIGEIGAEDEVYRLALYSSSATVEIRLGRRQPDLDARMGASLVLSDSDVRGRVVTDFTVAGGSLHRLVADVAPGWNVETVETIPTDAMADWFIDRRSNRRQLEIQLTTAASPRQRVSVIVVGRLQRFSLATPISTETLRALKWSEAHISRQLLSFQTANPFSIETVGNLPTLDRESLTETDRSLLDETTATGRVVDLSVADSTGGLQLSFKRPAFDCEIQSVIDINGTELQQMHHILFEPGDNSVDRLLVYASAPLGSGTKWVDRSSNAAVTAERLPHGDPQTKNLPEEGELWLLRLSRPASGSVVISASSTSKAFRQGSVPLLSLPEAIKQRGRILLHSNSATSCSAEPSGLTAIPLQADASDEHYTNSSMAGGAFRYDPAACLTAGRVPKLVLTANGRNQISSLLCHNAHIESFYWPDGRATHCCTFNVENLGTVEFKPPLSPDVHLKSAVVNGQSVGFTSSENSRSSATVHLPIDSQFVTVAIYFDSREPPLSTGAVINSPLEPNMLPILSGDWQVWLPADFEANDVADSRSRDLNWRCRLFGPLARSAEATAFNPLRAGDWARLVNGLTDWQITATARLTRSNLSVAPKLDINPPSDKSSLTTRDELKIWQAPGLNVGTTEVLPGWHGIHEGFLGADIPEPIVIEHVSADTAWSVASLLCSFLFGAWLCKRSIQTFVLLAAVATGLALFLSNAWAPLATGALWGLFLCALAEWPRRLMANNYPVEGVRRSAIVSAAPAFALVVALISSASAEPHGLTSDSQAIKPQVECVLIPVDGNQQPSGTKYYLSEKFLRKLLPQAADDNSRDKQWFIREAMYNVELVQPRAKADVSPGTWSLTFDIETFSRDTSIFLPLVRDEAIWQPTAMLDGVPQPLEWCDNDRRCSIHIDQPARYALTIFCTPRIAADEAIAKVTLTTLPSLPITLRLRAPSEISGIHINGTPVSSAADSSDRAVLAPSEHLVVEWPRTESTSDSLQNAAVTALNWLRIDASSIRLDTKYIIENGSHALESLAISYDKRWTPEPAPSVTAGSRDRDTSTGRRTMNVALPVKTLGRQEVEIHWQLADAPSLGNFQVPPVDLVSVPVTQRWIAVSSNPAFECSAGKSTASSTTPNEFIAKWGEASESLPPEQVFDYSALDRQRTITIRPRFTEPVVEDTLHIAIGEKALRIAFHVNVNPGKQRDSQCKLRVPANMVIDEVRLGQSERSIPTRYVRTAEDQLRVFFGESIGSEYRLTVIGKLPLNGSGPFSVPRVSLSGLATSTQRLQLYRDDDIQVELQHVPTADDSSTDPTNLPPVEWLVRPLGVFRLGTAAASASPSFSIKKNEPKVVGDSLTTLTRDSGSWSATCHCQFIVQTGTLDVLRLRAPTAWSEPFQMESNVPATIDSKLRDEHTRSLNIRFANTVVKGGKVDIKIRAQLSPATDTEVELPEIALETHFDGHRYAIVPTTLEGQSIGWTEAGVRAAAVPAVLVSPSTKPGRQRQLEIVATPFHVAQQRQATSQPSPRIRLADTFISTGERGGNLVVTRFVLAPDGLSNCSLLVPQGQEVRSIKLDGRPALVAASGNSHWHLSLGASQLPQFVEIVSQTFASDSAESTNELRRPILLTGEKPLPVDLSLWTVSPADQQARSVANVTPVAAVDQAALRLDRLVSITEATTATTGEYSDADIANWLVPWSKMLGEARYRAGKANNSSAAAPQVGRASEDLISRASSRMDAWTKQQSTITDLTTPTQSQNTTVESSNDLSEMLDSENAAHYVFEGGYDHLPLSGELLVSRRVTQGFGLFIVAAIASASLWFVRSPLALDFVCRWPHVVGVLIGIAWWAWLWPSWFGLAIAAATLWHSLRFNWPGRSIRAEASTVLRSTRSH